MKFPELAELYERWKQRHGRDTYRYVSQILREAKDFHHKDWLKNPTSAGDHEQSWRAFKGKNLEKLLAYIIKEEVEQLGLGIVEGNKLDRTRPENLPGILNKVWRNLQVKFIVDGKGQGHLPDIDLVIYDPVTADVLAVLSSKVTLRERIAQTGYWRIKLAQDSTTRGIKVFFITPDEDGTLTARSPMKKGRAIVEVDTDGAYVLTEADIESSTKVKSFDQFFVDLATLAKKS